MSLNRNFWRPSKDTTHPIKRRKVTDNAEEDSEDDPPVEISDEESRLPARPSIKPTLFRRAGLPLQRGANSSLVSGSSSRASIAASQASIHEPFDQGVVDEAGPVLRGVADSSSTTDSSSPAWMSSSSLLYKPSAQDAVDRAGLPLQGVTDSSLVTGSSSPAWMSSSPGLLHKPSDQDANHSDMKNAIDTLEKWKLVDAHRALRKKEAAFRYAKTARARADQALLDFDKTQQDKAHWEAERKDKNKTLRKKSDGSDQGWAGERKASNTAFTTACNVAIKNLFNTRQEAARAEAELSGALQAVQENKTISRIIKQTDGVENVLKGSPLRKTNEEDETESEPDRNVLKPKSPPAPEDEVESDDEL